jgi:hypothetical protein
VSDIEEMITRLLKKTYIREKLKEDILEKNKSKEKYLGLAKSLILTRIQEEIKDCRNVEHLKWKDMLQEIVPLQHTTKRSEAIENSNLKNDSYRQTWDLIDLIRDPRWAKLMHDDTLSEQATCNNNMMALSYRGTVYERFKGRGQGQDICHIEDKKNYSGKGYKYKYQFPEYGEKMLEHWDWIPLELEQFDDLLIPDWTSLKTFYVNNESFSNNVLFEIIFMTKKFWTCIAVKSRMHELRLRELQKCWGEYSKMLREIRIENEGESSRLVDQFLQFPKILGLGSKEDTETKRTFPESLSCFFF